MSAVVVRVEAFARFVGVGNAQGVAEFVHEDILGVYSKWTRISKANTPLAKQSATLSVLVNVLTCVYHSAVALKARLNSGLEK